MNDNSPSTIISLKDVRKIPGLSVTIDTSIEKAMNLTLMDGTVFNFNECGSGLYYYDMTRADVQDSAKTNATIPPYSLLSTVIDNKESYTSTDIEAVGRARIYQILLVWPETISFNTGVNNNILLNYKISLDDINRDEHIYGKATHILQDKMRRNTLTVHSKIDEKPLPLSIS